MDSPNSWMVFLWENPTKNFDDLGYPHDYGNLHISNHCTITDAPGPPPPLVHVWHPFGTHIARKLRYGLGQDQFPSRFGLVFRVYVDSLKGNGDRSLHEFDIA